MSKSNLTFADLFCGIGGFRLALEKCGLTCVFSSEIDPSARAAYHANFREHPSGDIRNVSAKDIPRHDVLCGGFPCQSFSEAGRRQPDLSLFQEIVRIAKYHEPQVLVLENVKNLIRIQNGNVIEQIADSLTNIGYSLKWDLLNSSYYGIPQKRERVYMVAIRTGISYNAPEPTFKKTYLRNALWPNPPEHCYFDRSDVSYDAAVPAPYLGLIRIGSVGPGRQGERIYSPYGHAATITADGGGPGKHTGLYLINDRVRKLSLNETKAVMGYKRSHTADFFQLGNAVIPAMIGHVFDGIKGLR